MCVCLHATFHMHVEMVGELCRGEKASMEVLSI
jgi:hypothetical protein